MRLFRWILWKLGKIDPCEYLHPNKTHWQWEVLNVWNEKIDHEEVY
jgi:hypothetical protein